MERAVEIRSDSPVLDRSSAADREWNIAAVRELLISAFDDLELTDLCADHFRSVAERFTHGMDKRQLVQSLLDYCIRHEQVALLIALVRERNPTQYERFAPRLGSHLGATTAAPIPTGPPDVVPEALTPSATGAPSSTAPAMSVAATGQAAEAEILNSDAVASPVGSSAKVLPWPLRFLKSVFWTLPLSVGRVAQRLGAKIDDVAAWLIGAVLILALVLMALGWITGGEIWAVVAKAFGR